MLPFIVLLLEKKALDAAAVNEDASLPLLLLCCFHDDLSTFCQLFYVLFLVFFQLCLDVCNPLLTDV